MAVKSVWRFPQSGFQRHVHHLSSAVILYPVLVALLLGAIWASSLNLVGVKMAAAQQAAAVSSVELAATYEAQVVRALREIDHTLKVVKYAYETGAGKDVLNELDRRSLLPPDSLFPVRVTDDRGAVVASTHGPVGENIADQDLFMRQRRGDVLSVAGAPVGGSRGDHKLSFSRRLDTPAGQFAGVVTVAVDADFFVSGYDSRQLGEQGLLGVMGPEGEFRVRRTADLVTIDDIGRYPGLIPPVGAESLEEVSPQPWDGVIRYVSARRIYGFPMTVVVGLSEAEQLAPARQTRRYYLWLAAAGSLLTLLAAGLLGWFSHQLEVSRRRAVREQLAHAERIEYLAYHDGLTSLPNRNLFSRILGDSLEAAHQQHTRIAVLFLDLDRFKQINDTLGHEVGDGLLQEVARRLKDCLRDTDTVARLGGDEFVILMPQVQELQQVAAVAQKILAAAARPFALLGQEFRITTSIGISLYPQDGLDEQTLMKNADIAMYQAKDEGKNTHRFYSEDLNANSLERLALESSLRRALERSEFELCYQTKRDVRSGRITGMEALLRWHHPDLGVIAPLHFIPVADETGLIVPIGKWVLKTACLQNVSWQQDGLPRLNMAVNLTTRQFEDDRLLLDLQEALAGSGMDPGLLELEITESLLMHDVDKNLKIISAIKALGVRIAIDDFGVGYSSLSTLQQFPLDTIKIDRSFIRDVTSQVEDKALTQAVIDMGRNLSLTVVAQGVETKEQADYLRENACDEFQGYYVDKPLPADQVAELLRTQ
jgi:diguanylate cyclase (GGDEF)-like protein